MSPGLCSSGPLSKHYLLQGSCKGAAREALGDLLKRRICLRNLIQQILGLWAEVKAFLEPTTTCVGSLVLRVRAVLVGRSRKLLFIVPTLAKPHVQLPSCQQDHRAFPASPGSLRLAGAGQGLGRGCARSSCCAGVASAWPQGLTLCLCACAWHCLPRQGASRCLQPVRTPHHTGTTVLLP